VLGADAGGEFLDRADAEEFVADLEGVGGESRGREGDAQLVAGAERRRYSASLRAMGTTMPVSRKKVARSMPAAARASS